MHLVCPEKKSCVTYKTYARLKNSENRLCLMENICYDVKVE